MIVGVSSAASKFFDLCQYCRLTKIYAFIHGLNIHPKFRIGDGAQSITRGIILYAHLSFNSYLTYTGYPKSMFISITTLSYFLTANNSTFKNLVRMIEDKYLKSSNNIAEVSSTFNTINIQKF